jgi:hypothetical protein
VLVAAPERIDRYKPESHAQRLVRQGDAAELVEFHGPRARIAAYESASLHFTLFASPLAPLPPPQVQVYTDGYHTGPLFAIRSAEEAQVLAFTPQSLAYRLAEEPDVLILGETTGVNTWLATLFGARSITAVFANPDLVQVVRDDLADYGGGVFARPTVSVVTESPRLFLERTERSYDIIHIASAEGMPASAGGLQSLREDYLLTISAMVAALERLRPGGLITVTRGLQSPPRDNLRMLYLLWEAASRVGMDPAIHLMQGRNYLAATTILSATPFIPNQIDGAREYADELSMDLDYFPGIEERDLTRRNIIPSAAGLSSDYYEAAAAAVAGNLEAFADEWPYELTPPTDDRPYFHSFFRLRSLPKLAAAYGQLWWERVELGYAVVAVTLLVVALLGIALVVVPVVVVSRRSRREHRDVPSAPSAGWVVLHFGAIGMGFMFLEMLFVQRLVRFLGDPLLATTATLTSILAFAGLGSALQARLPLLAGHRIAIGAGSVAVLTVIYAVLAGPLLSRLVTGSPSLRFVITVVSLAPVSFVMGWQFPAGMALVRGRQGMPPVAWAANGVAGVVAAPLAVVVSISAGLVTVSVAAAVLYAVVAVAGLVQAGRATRARR